MSITITSGDEFTFNVPVFTLTALFGQTVSHVTGTGNIQDVANGSSIDVITDQFALDTFTGSTTDISSAFIEDLLISLGIEDDTIIDTATAAYDDETEELLEDIFSDDSVVEEVLSVLEELVGDIGPFGSTDELFGEDDDGVDVAALLDGITEIYEDLGSSTELSIEINSGDTFNFNVGDTSVVKMFGQTVSYVSGVGNTQTVVNGIEVTASDTVSAPVRTIDAAQDERASLGALPPVTENTLANGFAGSPFGSGEFIGGIFDFLKDQFGGGDDGSSSGGIVIDSGDSFDFNIGDVEIVKLFGQTVSYVTGTGNDQTVTNGPVVEETSNSVDRSAPAAPATAPEATSSVEDQTPALAAAVQDSWFGGILEGVFDFFQNLFGDDEEDDPAILINSGDTFNFDIGDVEVVKMFGQTVSYASGTDNTQTVVNGAEIETEGNQFSFDAGDGAEEAPLTEVLQTAGVPLAGATESDSNTTLEILDAVAGLLEAQEDASSLSIVINTGDSFDFDIDDVSIVKMFGQTVSYVTGENNVQNVTNGSEIAAGETIETVSEDPGQIDPVPLAALSTSASDAPVVSVTGSEEDDLLFGSLRDDDISANGGNDAVIALAGDDSVRGGDGDDRITGGEGDDDLWGGAGDDIFFFGTNDGTDIINDFKLDEDKIDVSGAGITAFDELGIAQTADGALITYSGGDGAQNQAPSDQVLLVGVQSEDLSSNDFVFS